MATNDKAKKVGNKGAKKRAKKKIGKKAVKKAAVAKKGGERPKKTTAKKAPKVSSSAELAPFASPALAPCVPATQAGPLVMGCAGQAFNVETKLGVAFQSPNRREQFCQCVAARSGVPRAQIPCGAGDSFGDVIEAVSC